MALKHPPEQARRVVESYTRPVKLVVPPSIAAAALRGSS